MILPQNRNGFYIYPGLKNPDKKYIFINVRDHMLIASSVCEYLGINIREFFKKDRRDHLVFARHICMYILNKYCSFSFKRIGSIFGMDHTSIMYGVNLVQDQIKIGQIGKYEDSVRRIVNALNSSKNEI